jgi:hypothetical protein
MIEAFLPDMIAANHGHICAIGSMTSLVGSANLVPYSASKFAVRGAFNFFTNLDWIIEFRGKNAVQRHQTWLVCDEFKIRPERTLKKVVLNWYRNIGVLGVYSY